MVMGWLRKIGEVLKLVGRKDHNLELEVKGNPFLDESQGPSDESRAINLDFDIDLGESLDEWKEVVRAFYSAAGVGSYRSDRDFILIRKSNKHKWEEKWRSFFAALEEYEDERYNYVRQAAQRRMAGFEGKVLRVGKGRFFRILVG